MQAGPYPDFRALHGGNYAQTDLCVWCFDLLALKPAAPADDEGLIAPQPLPLSDTPEESRERFFREVVLPADGQRVSASDLYAAYRRWCMERRVAPMELAKFGLNGRDKKKSGSMFYQNCRLAEAYTLPPVRLAVNNQAAAS